MKCEKKVLVGSRGSKLALLQSRLVMDRLRALHPDFEYELVKVTTAGDRDRESPLEKLGGEGVFVKELEEALLAGRIDLAVHSLKDMLTTIPEGLKLAAVPERVDPRDVLVSQYGSLAALPKGAKVGTGSQRRAVQVLAMRPDIEIRGLRGNIDTRLKKALGGEYDGIIMAAAALIRLGLEDRIAEYLPAEEFVPAVGQGALGIETRADDSRIAALAAPLDHEPTHQAVTAERAFLKAMGGGCRAPIAALGTAKDGTLRLFGLVANPDGTRILRAEVESDASSGEQLGHALARKMIEMGAASLVLLSPFDKGGRRGISPD
ncbi:MAG: hydroxymethylbilane synthase [Chloroflexi bacterium]|nr:hydroxymethylbilane synthase [Chloroflexota bacterium]